ncbi:hypothetical protein JHK82_024523 [Glycine max]|nr:hypothetical protein JHK85_025122 [Glycine max]KAG5012360.1 hypothetical protein JHK86_024621 [Glycine max]KAG5133335.1 hypothetical protein JHK82_024523 [Glycine max]
MDHLMLLCSSNFESALILARILGLDSSQEILSQRLKASLAVGLSQFITQTNSPLSRLTTAAPKEFDTSNKRFITMNAIIKDFLFGVYSSSSNSETPTSYAHDSTTLTVHPIGKKSTKRKNKEKHAKSSTKDAQFIALQQQHKERMSKMDELVKARNEQNKVEEMKIMFMDTSA